MKIIQNPNIKFKKILSKRPYTKRIVIHHSASSDSTTVENIQQWHYSRGWSGIGYHYVIDQQGVITQGRPEDTQGAHAYQDQNHEANTDGIGICVIGNFMDSRPTDKQLDSLVWLIQDIRTRYGDIPAIGHRDVMATACPGNKFPLWEVQRRVASPHEDKPSGTVKINLHGHIEDVPAVNVEGSNYIPVRWLARLGYSVEWDGRSILVRYK